MKRLFLKHHQPKILDVLTEFNIKQQELITGVQCPICEYFTMERASGSWRCSNCNSLSKTAHEKGIIEFILINQGITSQQCKKFLCLPSIHIAYQLLKQLPLTKKGGNKNRIYSLHPKYPE
jgi:ribosomal protein L37AE/L43A